MKRLLRSASAVEIGIVRGLLAEAGIDSITKNEQLGGALGDIPFLECEPELWVVRDADFYRAQQILQSHRKPAQPAAQWRCPDCGELIEGQFEACWQCGTPDPQS